MATRQSIGNPWVYEATGAMPTNAAEFKAQFPALAKYSEFMAQPAVRIANLAASAALTYHGYKRNGRSIGWALAWGILVPNLIGLPIALAQGFGKPK